MDNKYGELKATLNNGRLDSSKSLLHEQISELKKKKQKRAIRTSYEETEQHSRRLFLRTEYHQ